jgi:hypothetical protein
MGIFRDYPIDKTTPGRALDSAFDQSGTRAITETIANITNNYDTEQVQRDIILGKPELANKIKEYQNTTDVSNPDYIQGYTQLVDDIIPDIGLNLSC